MDKQEVLEDQLFSPWYCEPSLKLFWSLLEEYAAAGITHISELSDRDCAELTFVLIDELDPFIAWEFITETKMSDQLIPLLADAVKERSQAPKGSLTGLSKLKKLGQMQVNAAIDYARSFIEEGLAIVLINEDEYNYDRHTFSKG